MCLLFNNEQEELDLESCLVIEVQSFLCEDVEPAVKAVCQSLYAASIGIWGTVCRREILNGPGRDMCDFHWFK